MKEFEKETYRIMQWVKKHDTLVSNPEVIPGTHIRGINEDDYWYNGNDVA